MTSVISVEEITCSENFREISFQVLLNSKMINITLLCFQGKI